MLKKNNKSNYYKRKKTSALYRRPVLYNRHPVSHKKHIYSIFHITMASIAIYLSYYCNEKFDLKHFFGALCCPYLYIIYFIATKGSLKCA